MRLTYGVDFAISNSRRAARRSDHARRTTARWRFLPGLHTAAISDHPRGQVFSVLPFGNIVVTLSVNGAELKTMLENGVSFILSRAGAFPAGLWPLLHL